MNAGADQPRQPHCLRRQRAIRPCLCRLLTRRLCCIAIGSALSPSRRRQRSAPMPTSITLAQLRYFVVGPSNGLPVRRRRGALHRPGEPVGADPPAGDAAGRQPVRPRPTGKLILTDAAKDLIPYASAPARRRGAASAVDPVRTLTGGRSPRHVQQRRSPAARRADHPLPRALPRSTCGWSAKLGAGRH